MRAFAAAIILALSTLVVAEQQATEVKSEAQLSPEVVMDRLIEKGFGHAVKALEESGGFYPFGLVRDGTGRVHFLAYGGDIEQRPVADQYAYELVWQMRNLTAENSQIQSAVVVRPTMLTAADGSQIPSIHFIVDHRDSRPRTVVFPILQQEEEYFLGDPVVLDSDDFLMMNSPDAQLERSTGEPE